MSFFEKLLHRLLDSLLIIPVSKMIGNYYQAGQIYENGILRKHSLKTAAECYAKGTKQSRFDYKATFRLATIYENGEGVIKNYKLAAKLYKLVIDSGFYEEKAYAMNNLGILYKHGYGVDKDIQESIRLLKLSLNSNLHIYNYNPCSLINIKHFDLEHGLRCPQDIKESFETCKKLAGQGDKEIQYQLAQIYKFGKYATKSETKYEEWFIKAANSGHESALAEISVDNKLRLETERDEKTIQDAEKGNAVAQYELAVMCLHFRHYGFGSELSRLTIRSAKQGYVKAQYLLGLLYEGGKYVPEDHPSTNERVFGPMPQTIPDDFEPSPGSLFMTSDGVPPNYPKAIEWYILAAKQGHETAKLRLKHLDYSINIDEEPPSWLEEVPPWDEDKIPKDEPQWIEAKIIEGLNQHGIFSIWHMTHKDNIEEILNKGIFSHTLAYKKTKPKDISDHDVQKWRESNEPIYDRKLHDYAPTYINIKNPMLYVKRNIQNELCLIEISLSVLTNDNFVFCDGNAASRNTKFYNLVEDLEKLPWDVLNASYWNDLEDGKRKRCAEILIHPLIEPKYISKIHCLSHDTLVFISRFNVQSEITDELFFGSEVSESKSSPFNDDIPF